MLARDLSAQFLVLLVGLAGFSTGCSVYDSSLLTSSKAKTDASVDSSIDAPGDTNSEAQPDATGDTALGDSDASDSFIPDSDGGDSGDASETGDLRYCDDCKDLSLYRPPCAPKVSDLPSLTESLVFASRAVRMGTDADKPDDWRSLGADQDCLKTTSAGEPTGCKRAVSASKAVLEDGVEGRDNSFALNVGYQFRMLAKAGMTSPEKDASDRFILGKNAPTFRISEYNGTRNDPSVTFAFFTTTYTVDSQGNYLAAKWDGKDIWEIGPESVYTNGNPRYYDDNAYVSNGVLVAHLQNGLQLKFVGNGTALVMSLNEPRFVANLSTDLTELTDASLVAVWQREDALMNLDLFAGMKDICPGDTSFMLMHGMVNNAVDIRLDLKPAVDKECNAISVSMVFAAARAKLGGIGAAEIMGTSKCDAGAP